MTASESNTLKTDFLYGINDFFLILRPSGVGKVVFVATKTHLELIYIPLI